MPNTPQSLESLREIMTRNELPMFSWAESFYRYDPGMYEAYVAWTTRAREHVELEPKVREFLAIAIDSVVSWPSPYFDVHMNKAFDAGATAQEIADVILATGRLMGPHAYTHGLNTLDKVVKERGEKGLKTPMHRGE
ncbi:MAG: gamma-carboxymuconolactone decarboxylase [Acidimicrobiaceae bacterium]|nr:gamma-carboxymuconolactone decarboxylase [Acidimicrobiaceae bacterium]